MPVGSIDSGFAFGQNLAKKAVAAKRRKGNGPHSAAALQPTTTIRLGLSFTPSQQAAHRRAAFLLLKTPFKCPSENKQVSLSIPEMDLLASYCTELATEEKTLLALLPTRNSDTVSIRRS
ncbi:MAG: hypothetical protein DMG96_12545 [Acidobacteria bacterium]|nr:MAG: hypothetical protein DMG96_12545 [Acidobacteriota bacterium]